MPRCQARWSGISQGPAHLSLPLPRDHPTVSAGSVGGSWTELWVLRAIEVFVSFARTRSPREAQLQGGATLDWLWRGRPPPATCSGKAAGPRGRQLFPGRSSVSFTEPPIAAAGPGKVLLAGPVATGRAWQQGSPRHWPSNRAMLAGAQRQLPPEGGTRCCLGVLASLLRVKSWTWLSGVVRTRAGTALGYRESWPCQSLPDICWNSSWWSVLLASGAGDRVRGDHVSCHNRGLSKV